MCKCNGKCMTYADSRATECEPYCPECGRRIEVSPMTAFDEWAYGLGAPPDGYREIRYFSGLSPCVRLIREHG